MSESESRSANPELVQKGPPASNAQLLRPFPFQLALRDHYKGRTRTWKWFSEQQVRKEQEQAHRQALLKNTYRLDRPTYGAVYELADKAVRALNIDAEVTLYQEQNTSELNAGISIIGKEAHVVLSGRLMELLTSDELLAVLGHELAHYLFYTLDDAEHEVTTRVAYAIANDERSEEVHLHTARAYALYMELFCDRGALHVTENLDAVLSALIKMHTGLAQVNTQSYIQQALDVVSMENTGSEGHSHPENYIRCLALHYYQDDAAQATEKIEQVVSGPLDINTLDIFRQKTLQDLTREVLLLATKPKWMHSTAVGALCRSYFPDLKRDTAQVVTDELRRQVQSVSANTRDYLCYVLMDVMRCDPEQEEVPLGHVLELAELLELNERFDRILRKELKLGARELTQLKQQAVSALAGMQDSADDSLQPI